MTAELFIKLSAKLYSDRKHLPEDPDDEQYYESTPEETHSGDEDETGGALLNPYNPNGSPNSMKDDLPPAWHAKQLNPFAVLGDYGEDLPAESKLQQWIPPMSSSFWNIYVNKLRVNASEGGICDLNEESDDE